MGWNIEIDLRDVGADVVGVCLTILVSPRTRQPKQLPFDARKLADDVGVDLDQPLNVGKVAERVNWTAT